MLYSLPLANWLTRQGYELYAKSDLRFIEGLYKVLRDVFHYHPRLSKEQFLSVGFAERKVILTTQVLLLSQAKHQQLTVKENADKQPRKKRFDHSKSSVNSSIVTIVRAESQLTTPPAYEAPFDVPHPPRDPLQPIALHTMYGGSVSTHQATPSSDLEMTPPPSPQVSLCTHTPERATVNSCNANSVVMDTQATHVTSPRTTTLYTTTTNHADGTALTREYPHQQFGTNQEVTNDVEQTSNDSIAMLLTISSRIDDIVRTVESMSARVDLVETQMKMIESSQNSTAVSDRSTVTSNRAQNIIPQSSNIDTPHIPQYKQSVQFPTDLTHCNTHHTPHTSHFTHSPPNLSPPYSPATHHDHSLRTSQPYRSTPPSTPEEAHRLIASLRSRARKTRDFLHHANSIYN
ncbi:uncharacterized protein LOC135350232 isoform X2 [Halichondria panicea]